MRILILKYAILKIDYASCVVTGKSVNKFLFEYNIFDLPVPWIFLFLIYSKNCIMKGLDVQATYNFNNANGYSLV